MFAAKDRFLCPAFVSKISLSSFLFASELKQELQSRVKNQRNRWRLVRTQIRKYYRRHIYMKIKTTLKNTFYQKKHLRTRHGIVFNKIKNLQ